ncbi:hypothetical protein H4R21_005088 [Coemansia helicoidea]|nr:hypothetical protein H4R21_005088 [Coemansia helicoidea]
MNGQFSAYDDAGAAAAPTDLAGNHISTLAFSGAPDDYEGYENARARKRRMTVSGRPRLGEHAAFHIPDAGCSSGPAETASASLFGMLDQHTGGYVRAHPVGGNAGPHVLSSLPLPPGSEAAPLAGSLPFGDAGFAQSVGMYCGDSEAGFVQSPPTHNPLSPLALGRAVARKPQTLNIAVNRHGNNE